MFRRLSLVLLPLLVTQRAAAHGAAPAVLSVLGWDDQGVQSVRLAQGIAQRAGAGFRYVCPEAWGGDALAPAVALSEGPTLIAGAQLSVLDAEGRVSPHPEEVGKGVALARGGDTSFGLFVREGRVELRRVDATHTELLQSFGEPFSVLAASAQRLAVMHFAQRTLVVQTLSRTGELGERVSWEAASGVAFAELRSVGEQLFAVIWGRSAPWVTLGRVTAQGFEVLREGQSTIAGPLALAEGVALAIDGAPELLDASDEGALGAGSDSAIQCLESFAGRDFACVSGALRSFDARGLGAPVFQLASLEDPDYQLLPEAVRADCAFRWRDLREHVAMLNGEASGAPEGGMPADDDAAAADAAPDAGMPSERSADACALRAGGSRSWRWPWAALLLGFAFRSARRRNHHAR